MKTIIHFSLFISLFVRIGNLSSPGLILAHHFQQITQQYQPLTSQTQQQYTRTKESIQSYLMTEYPYNTTSLDLLTKNIQNPLQYKKQLGRKYARMRIFLILITTPKTRNMLLLEQQKIHFLYQSLQLQFSKRTKDYYELFIQIIKQVEAIFMKIQGQNNLRRSQSPTQFLDPLNETNMLEYKHFLGEDGQLLKYHLEYFIDTIAILDAYIGEWHSLEIKIMNSTMTNITNINMMIDHIKDMKIKNQYHKRFMNSFMIFPSSKIYSNALNRYSSHSTKDTARILEKMIYSLYERQRNLVSIYEITYDKVKRVSSTETNYLSFFIKMVFLQLRSFLKQSIDDIYSLFIEVLKLLVAYLFQ